MVLSLLVRNVLFHVSSQLEELELFLTLGIPHVDEVLIPHYIVELCQASPGGFVQLLEHARNDKILQDRELLTLSHGCCLNPLGSWSDLDVLPVQLVYV